MLPALRQGWSGLSFYQPQPRGRKAADGDEPHADQAIPRRPDPDRLPPSGRSSTACRRRDTALHQRTLMGTGRRHCRQQPGLVQHQPRRDRHYLGRPEQGARRLPGDLEEVQRQVALVQERQHRQRRERLPRWDIPHGLGDGGGNRLQRPGASPVPQLRGQRRRKRTLDGLTCR